MQYNLVVATNEGAVRLWQKLGFYIVGTLTGAFEHPKLGYVDAHIMYKTLET
ncbi:GCN5-related N-acetyltransferase [Rhodopirellula sallentina SM41]|uniref:GCN5-related N-acetyltransferase n=2 Tax=Rhodopirellula TaxID=265488 RepID=M5U5B9_9BACT|nr:GCN5-related N-acetyltransferase [Rhodopirellula sallentina SM41]